MAAPFRIATWNLERSGVHHPARIRPQLDAIRQLNADLWVLTETHTSVALKGYSSVASRPDPTYHSADESCAAIWSRWPLRQIETADPILTVCGELAPPHGAAKLLVYGTIITYGGDGVKEGAKPWARHREAVRSQTVEWKKLRDQYPDHLFCVAGDFNENLDGTRWYGVRDAKEGIRKGLAAADLRCATDVDLRARGMTRATVDHICLSSNFGGSIKMDAWEGTVSGVKLSDHNGVLVDVEMPRG
jgi:hypothetical protein